MNSPLTAVISALVCLVFLSVPQMLMADHSDVVFNYNGGLEHDDLFEVCPYDLIAAECSNSYMENDALSNEPSATLKLLTKGWMGELDDSHLLSELSIPGTHDSGAEAPEQVGAATQTWNIYEQLQAGIR